MAILSQDIFEAAVNLADLLNEQNKGDAYDRGKYIYSMRFETSAATGQTTVMCHLQWETFKECLKYPGGNDTIPQLEWSSYNPECVHLQVGPVNGVVYVTVLTQEQLKTMLHEAGIPNEDLVTPEYTAAAEDLWVRYFGYEYL